MIFLKQQLHRFKTSPANNRLSFWSFVVKKSDYLAVYDDKCPSGFQTFNVNMKKGFKMEYQIHWVLEQYVAFFGDS